MDDASSVKWEGRWDQVKGKAKEAWGHLTDDDMDVAEGNMDQLVGKIKEKTGESAESIRAKLESGQSPEDIEADS